MLSNITKIVTMMSTLSGLLNLISPIRTLIQQVESTTATGAEKKSAVMQLITTGLTTVESVFSVDLPNDTVLNFADKVIDAIVAIENAIGSFTHKTTATAES